MTPIIDDRLRQAYEYWRRKAGARQLPSRLDIDPVEIPRLLPHIMLVDVMGADLYRYRLIGTEIATAMGVNATGRLVHEMLLEDGYRAAGTLLVEDERAALGRREQTCQQIARHQRCAPTDGQDQRSCSRKCRTAITSAARDGNGADHCRRDSEDGKRMHYAE